MKVENLFEDIKDGVYLLSLLEALSGEKLVCIIVSNWPLINNKIELHVQQQITCHHACIHRREYTIQLA